MKGLALTGSAAVVGSLAAYPVISEGGTVEGPLPLSENVSQVSGEPPFGYQCREDWLGEAPVISPSEIAEIFEAEIVICGAGAAGIQAALSASQGGAKVAVIEKQPEESFSCIGDDICSYNSQFVMNRGFGPYNLDEIVNEFVRRGAGRVDAEIVRKFVCNSGAMLDNLVSIMPASSDAFDFDAGNCQIQIAYGMDNGSYYPIERSGFKAWAGTIQTMGNIPEYPVKGRDRVTRLTELGLYAMDESIRLGATWYFENTATVLVQNGNGDVTGVIAKRGDGSYAQYNASKGVVLTTGDFSANADMVYNLLNDVNEVSMRVGADRYEMGGMGEDGTGHKMGCWAGGFIESFPRPSMNTNGGNPGPWGTAPFLWINAKGKRFMNETLANYTKPTILKQPLGPVASICDADFMDTVKNAGLDHGAPNWGAAGVDFLKVMEKMESDMWELVGTGEEGGSVTSTSIVRYPGGGGGSKVYCGQTIEELLGYMGYSDEALQTALQTVEEYNSLCDSGVDSQYGKDSIVLKPLRTAPFFGAVANNNGKATTGLVTLAGLMTDSNFNVLGADRTKPIKGLYAAGNCLGQRFGIGYSTPSAGASMGMAMTHGYVLGKELAAL